MGQLVFTPAVELFLPCFAPPTSPTVPTPPPPPFEHPRPMPDDLVTRIDTATCPHANYDVDEEHGYTCADCGMHLVFCVKCMNDIIRTGVPGQHVHLSPECDEAADRVCRKDFLGRGRRGAFD